MKRNPLCAAAFVLIVFCSSAIHAEEAPDLKPIFNGKDLSGWKAPDDNIWWKAEDGILKVRSGPKKKGSILQTEAEFSDFVVDLEFKFGEGTVDSGVFIRNNREQIQIGISGIT